VAADGSGAEANAEGDGRTSLEHPLGDPALAGFADDVGVPQVGQSLIVGVVTDAALPIDVIDHGSSAEVHPPARRTNTMNDSHANFITDSKNKNSFWFELNVQKKEWDVKNWKSNCQSKPEDIKDSLRPVLHVILASFLEECMKLVFRVFND